MGPGLKRNAAKAVDPVNHYPKIRNLSILARSPNRRNKPRQNSTQNVRLITDKKLEDTDPIDYNK